MPHEAVDEPRGLGGRGVVGAVAVELQEVRPADGAAAAVVERTGEAGGDHALRNVEVFRAGKEVGQLGPVGGVVAEGGGLGEETFVGLCESVTAVITPAPAAVPA